MATVLRLDKAISETLSETICVSDDIQRTTATKTAIPAALPLAKIYVGVVTKHFFADCTPL